MNEEMAEVKNKGIEDKASKYFDKYRAHMSVFEHKSLLAKTRKVGMYDIYALGKQLEAFDSYKAFCEDQGNVNLLGKLPSIAYDVITAVQGASILPVIASVQPIDEEQGVVYFKQVRSATTRGSQTAGNVVVDPRTSIATPIGYANNAFTNVNAIATASGTFSYTFTLAGAPVKSQSLSLFLDGTPAVKARDFGSETVSGVGEILGAGVSGTITYATGSVTLLFSANPGVSFVNVSYQQNYELATDIPQIDTFFASKSIMARVYALKGTMGMLQSFGMSKRFGMVTEDELAKDLVQEINREIGGDLIRAVRSGAMGTTTFSRTAPAGVSYFEHKQTYKDQLAIAESVMVGNAGRGNASVIIAGRTHCNVLQTLPGFTKLSDGTTLGSHIFGTLDGVTVVRVLEANILGAEEGVVVWKGLSPFEAAAVYAPYMPLAVTGTLPQSPNPLNSMKAAAVWAGVDNLVPAYATKLDVVA